jgi:ferredoxin
VPKVTFEMESVTADIPDGATIWEAARKAGVVLQRGFAAIHPCPGKGTCPGMACAVFLRTADPQKAVSPPTWREKYLHRRIFKSGKRLACQCAPKRDLTVVTMP